MAVKHKKHFRGLRDKPLAVQRSLPCSICQATIGNPCKGVNGNTLSYMHKLRETDTIIYLGME